MSGFARRSIRPLHLLPLIVLLLVPAVLLTWSQDQSASPWTKKQRSAAERMASAFPVLVEALETRGLEIDPRLDPNRTGLIGEEFTELTTTIGALEAKRTSTNPAFAALLVDWLKQAGLVEGQRVLVALSGSFPSLAVASIIACEELALEPIIVSSVGASSYGANRVGFAWPDIESVLFEADIIHHRSALHTLGGEADLGYSYFGEGRRLAVEAIERSGLPALMEETPQAQDAQRLAFVEAADPALMINIGGNQLNVGGDGHLLPPGVITSSRYDPEQLGLIGWFVSQDIPVIHLLHIRDLAMAHGLPIDPIPLPALAGSATDRTAVGLFLPVVALLPPILYLGWLVALRFLPRASGRRRREMHSELGEPEGPSL